MKPVQKTMVKEFIASNCSIYTFDTRESSKVPALFELDEMNLRAGGGTLGANGNVFRDDKTTGMDSLKSLAKKTGGKYFSNIILHDKSLKGVSTIRGHSMSWAIPSTRNLTASTTKSESKLSARVARFSPNRVTSIRSPSANIQTLRNSCIYSISPLTKRPYRGFR